MNTLRQLFSARTLVALRQNTLVNLNTLPVDSPSTTSLNTTARNNSSPLLPKELLSASLLNHSQIKFANESFAQQYKNLDRKLEIAYRCKICNTRNIKIVTEVAYNKGVVILECDGCSTTHLIVDNLGWFTNSKGKSINQVLAEKGELIRKIVVNEKGEVFEN